MLVGFVGDELDVGPSFVVGVEEVVGPGCWLAGLVPPDGVAAGGEDGEVEVALAGVVAHAAGSSSGS